MKYVYIWHSSDIHLHVSVLEFPGTWCSSTTTWVNFCRWGWVQPGENQTSGPKHYWAKGHSARPWSAWRKYHLVCRHQCTGSPASPLHPQSLQHSPHYSLSGHTSWNSSPGLARAAPVCWIMSVFIGLLWSGTGSPTIIDSLHSTCHLNLNWTEWTDLWTDSNWGVLFSMALEGLWLSTTCPHASSTIHVRGMRWHWGAG